MTLPPKKDKKFKLPKILTREGMRQFRKTDEFKQLKYFFAPNMSDWKYLFYHFLLMILFVYFYAKWGN